MPKKRKILLLGWDGADWEHINPLLEAGEMPTLAALIEQGVMGNLATLQPMVSPMLWNSIATGKTADKHGVHGFIEEVPGGKGARPWTSINRHTKAVWNILQQNGWKCNAIAWWASHPAEPLDGIVVSNAFRAACETGSRRALEDAIHPPEMTDRLVHCRMKPAEVTGADLRPFIPRAAEVDQQKDDRLQMLARVLADTVTTQALATDVLEAGDWDFSAVYFDSVDHFCHGFMPYHPPRMPGVGEEEFAIYKDVIRGCYRFHDMMLQRLLEIAGPDTTLILCSDHGFHSRHLRPPGTPREPAGPVYWHRDMGIILLHGPGIRSGERIFGANILDITPTILALADLPVGRDMDGKPLIQAFAEPPEISIIPSWDDVPGNDGRHPPGRTLEPDDATAAELIRQFAALGYVEEQTTDATAAAIAARTESEYNLAQVYLATDRPDLAIALLENLLCLSPWETRFCHQLANAYVRAGYCRAAGELLAKAWPDADAGRLPPAARLTLARARAGRGDFDGSAALLRHIVARSHPLPAVLVDAGDILAGTGHWAEAQAAYELALKNAPDCAAAWRGLSECHLKNQRNEAAAEAALDALQHLYHMPRAHFTLGVALARLGRRDEAIEAFDRTTRMNPRHHAARRWIGLLIPAEPGNDFASAAHLAEARSLRRENARARLLRRSRVNESRPLPTIPPPDARRKRILAARPLPEEIKAKRAASGRTLTLVSGLPRSGTSLMMQMLAAGGLQPMTDGLRTADNDNPNGYYEWEAVKTIGQHPGLFDDPSLDRRSIKVISMLLDKLPAIHRYRIIFMMRDPAEIALSQARMLQRRGTEGMEGDPDSIARTLLAHRRAILHWLHSQKDLFDILHVDYAQLLSAPAPAIAQIMEFLGPELLPVPENMTGVIRSGLHRQKSVG